MAAREGQEGFVRGCAMREGRLQQSLEDRRGVFGLHVAIYFLPDIGLGTEAAAGQDVKAVIGVIAVLDGDARAYHADIADKMLRTGVMTAGDMDVDRRIHLDASVAPVRD